MINATIMFSLHESFIFRDEAGRLMEDEINMVEVDDNGSLEVNFFKVRSRLLLDRFNFQDVLIAVCNAFILKFKIAEKSTSKSVFKAYTIISLIVHVNYKINWNQFSSR